MNTHFVDLSCGICVECDPANPAHIRRVADMIDTYGQEGAGIIPVCDEPHEPPTDDDAPLLDLTRTIWHDGNTVYVLDTASEPTMLPFLTEDIAIAKVNMLREDLLSWVELANRSHVKVVR